jgi:2-haloacid dehalogenase
VLDLAVQQAMTDTMTGQFRPFAAYLRAALAQQAAVVELGPEHVDAGVEAARALPSFPDAGAALQRLTEAGHRVSTLTNTAENVAHRALEQAGLAGFVHAVIGADAVGAYKPDARIYRHALERLEAAPTQAWLVAGHWWDVTGAKRAGLRTAWVARHEGMLLETAAPPDVTAADLGAVAEGILSVAD